MNFTYFIAVVCLTIKVSSELHTKMPGSFNFHKFRGPVSGPVNEVWVPDPYGGERRDFVAKPDYFFHYGVQDKKTKNSQGHKEARDGDGVTGEYRVLQDDGLVRIVRYTADADKGFRADVEYVRLKDY